MAGKARKKHSRHSKSGRIALAAGWLARFLRVGIHWGLVVLVWGVIATGFVVAWYAYDLPDVDKQLAATRRPSVTVLGADGSVLATYGDLYGIPVSVSQLPAALPAAVLATEDRRFYRHFGLDLIGLARAVWVDIIAGRIVQGGSTITQQVAKNLFLTPRRTIKRKVQEVLLALWLERKLSKDQILSVYLNRVYLGAGTFGVEAASKKYFSKSVRDVSLYEAAMLAGLLKAPSSYNPLANPKRSAKRTRQVLANMVAAGYLSKAQSRAAIKDRASVLAGSRNFSEGRYFADWVMERTAAYLSPGDSDITVTTTLDAKLQRQAEGAVAAALDGAGRKARVSQAALVAISPDGAVRAMVGGRSYSKSQFNRATQALRQPGSAFKPIVYLAGLRAGLNPRSILVDGPITIDGWSPENFSRKFKGRVTLSQALAGSINTVAVRVAERAGIKNVIDTAHRLGITSDFRLDPSIALGTGEVSLIELTSAYGTFANGGTGVWAYGIVSISDDEGRILYRRSGSGPGRVVSPANVAAINKMMSEVIRSGTGRAAAIPRAVAGKTGTSQNFRDAWFIGYSADLVAGVWMGNDDSKPMHRVTGGGLPARIWKRFMSAAHQGLPRRPLPGMERIPEKKGFWKRILAKISSGEG